MLFLLTHPENEQQALVGAATENGAKRLLAQKTQDTAWYQSPVKIPSEEARDTVLWVSPLSIESRKVVKPSSKPSKKEKEKVKEPDGANRNDGA